MAGMALRAFPWDRDVCRDGFRLLMPESPLRVHLPPPGRLSPWHQSSSSGESVAGASIFRQPAAHSRPLQGEPGRAESSKFLA